MVSEWKKIILQPYLKVRKILEITCITNFYNPLEQNRVMNFLPWTGRSGFNKLPFVPVSEKYPMCPEHD